jgi:hypothetical protein
MNILVAGALLLAQAAPAEPPCITPEEAGAMAVTLLPEMVDSVARRCQPQLGAGAFLGQQGAAEWSARLRRDAGPMRPLALQGVAKFGGSDSLPAGMNPEVTFTFISQMVANLLANDLPAESCADLDAIARSLSPLPASNLAMLVGASARLIAANEARKAAAEAAEATQAAAEPDVERPRPSICQA